MSARVRLSSRLTDLVAPDDDRALLARFAEERDEPAFAQLVRRHGAMVLGVCRRAVRDSHLAEDAFQAVFLVLARNPAAAVGATSVGGWLFGVARRVGLAARRHERRYARRAGLLATRGADTPRSEEPKSDFDDLLRVLDEELAVLPDEPRAALVACFLEERTHDEAARHLGWSLSTLRRRLDRGKALLRARLTRRGVTLGAGLFAGFLAPSATAAVPPALLDAVMRGTPPSRLVASLAAGALGRVGVGKLAVASVVVALGGLAIGFGAADRNPPPVPPQAVVVEQAPAPRPVAPSPWVTLRGRVVVPDGVPVSKPEPLPWEQVKDAGFFRAIGPVFDEKVLVNSDSRGVRNVVVWLRPDSDDRAAPFPADRIHLIFARPPREHEVVIDHGRFAPRVTVARAGDTLAFWNSNPIPFNVNYKAQPGAGADPRDFNVLLRPEQSLAAATPLPVTPLPGLFRCGIHPWMQGYVWAFDHPYATVTDDHGNFTIPNAPAGRWRLVVWHENAGYWNGIAGRLGEVIELAGGTEFKPIPFDVNGQ